MPRGKLLGGSSGINYMMYVRGSSQDYDDWAELAKDEGWSAKVMNEYMRKHQVRGIRHLQHRGQDAYSAQRHWSHSTRK